MKCQRSQLCVFGLLLLGAAACASAPLVATPAAAQTAQENVAGSIRVEIKSQTLGHWFETLAIAHRFPMSPYRDAEILAARFTPVLGRSAWTVDIAYPQDAQGSRSGSNMERHFVVNLDSNTTLRFIAEEQPGSDADWDETLAALDELIGSLNSLPPSGR